MNAPNLQGRVLHDRALELAAAFDFDLTAADATELESHLAGCPACTRRAAALRVDAHALARPLTLLPSARVDDAVYAAIARGTGQPRRLVLLAAAVLLLVALLGVVAVGSYLLREQEALPSAVTPSPTPFLAVASPGPRPSPSVKPVPTAIDPVVVLRVDIRGDVSLGRTPSLTVYRDGTVLRPNDGSGTITRLTPAGLELLVAPATGSDLLVTSGEIPPDPGYQAGFTTYTIDLRRGAEMVHRSTTNVLLTPATRAETERIIALAERLVDLEGWLPPDAWATGPADSEPYIASHYLLKQTSFKEVGVDYPPVPLDVADVVWPLPGSLQGFGDLQESPPPQDGTTARCGLVTASEATAVQEALASAPLTQMGDQVLAELDWALVTGHVTVSLAPLLPDDPRDCVADSRWP